MTAALEGMKILVVEDEFLVAMLLQDMLESAGCTVSGPIAHVAEALDAVDHETYDAAVLDVNLGGERIDPVAHALSDRNIPFVFVTGYGVAALPEAYAERPRLRKPFRMAELLGTLASFTRARCE
ncbi:MAG TPA: response regulator [Stellaceae bacterium]|jgi:CheY-like chemotaxis protein|nr:response regulator [Stellaceae bacterium]